MDLVCKCKMQRLTENETNHKDASPNKSNQIKVQKLNILEIQIEIRKIYVLSSFLTHTIIVERNF